MRLRPNLFDALVVGFVVAQQAEVWLVPVPGPRAAVIVAALGWTVPLLARRRWPFAAPAGAFAVQILASFADPEAVGSALTGLPVLLLTFWVAGTHSDRTHAVAGTAIGWAAVAVIAQRDVRLDLDNAVLLIVCGAAVAAVAHRLRRAADDAATLAAHAVRLEREREQHLREVTATERDRIAADLHELVTNSIAVMTSGAAQARLLLGADPARAGQVAASVEETGRSALAEMRRVLGILRRDDHDRPLAPTPGIAELRALIERCTSAGRAVELAVEGEPVALPAGVDRAAFRIVDEALRDANPGSVRITVRYCPEALQLEVANGRGGVPAMAGVRDRIKLYGGVLEVGPDGGGGGCAVLARFPIGGPR